MIDQHKLYNLVDFHRKMSDRPTYLPKADILVVDDTPDNLRLLIEILVERGYKVRPRLQWTKSLSGCQNRTSRSDFAGHLNAGNEWL